MSEIINCKDCKWYKKFCGSSMGTCHVLPPAWIDEDWLLPTVLDDDFCSKAEKKEETTNENR